MLNRILFCFGLKLSYRFYKLFIKLNSFFVDTKYRQRWKGMRQEFVADVLVKKAKWAISYSVFDGEELLEASIKSVRKDVDYINVVYQKKSWYGNPCSRDFLPLLKSLQKSGLIDELIEYKPNYKLSAQKQEREKRNIGLKCVKRRKCNYFMTMDTDEFYLSEQIKFAKRYIIKNGVTHSFCPVVNYKDPISRSLNTPRCFVQCFSKLRFCSRLCFNKHGVVLVDPTRQLSHFCFAKYFVIPNIEMHHMTGFRKNINKKLQNLSFKLDIKNKLDGLDKNIVNVPDLFDLCAITIQDK